MRHTPRAARACALVGVLVLATACSSEPDEARSLDLSDRESSSSSPEGAPSEDSDDRDGGTTSRGDAAGDALPTSYPEVGLEFDSLPRVSGSRQEALAAYVAYERGLRRLSRTARPNALITDHAEPPLIATMNSTIDFLRSNDTRYRGESRISVELEEFEPPLARLTLCTDGTGLELVTDGQVGPIEGPPRVAGLVILSSASGSWKLSQYDTLEESC